MTRLLTGLLLFAATACATPILSTDDLAVKERSFGIYAKSGEDLRHLESTTTIPCELGTVFGTQVGLAYAASSRVQLPIRGEWTQPAVPEIREGSELFLPDPFLVRRGKYDLGLEIVTILEKPQELVSGDYTLRLFDPHGDHVYYKRTFSVEECR